jgi:hypothetical protein
LVDKYEIKTNLKPTYLQADFNGNGIKDIATMIVERKGQKKGILLIHDNNNQFVIDNSNFSNEEFSIHLHHLPIEN